MTLLIACMFHGVMLWIETTAPLSPESTVSSPVHIFFFSFSQSCCDCAVRKKNVQEIKNLRNAEVLHITSLTCTADNLSHFSLINTA